MRLQLAVVGDPVAHSRSPELHRGFMAAAHVAGQYDAIRVPPGTLAEAVVRLRHDGYVGLNVTTPLKEEAYALCTELDETAAQARSVNTLSFAGEAIKGANTDGTGAAEALEDALGASLNGRSILILGAGPTARAAAIELHNRGARLQLWNRTPGRWDELCATLGASRLSDVEPIDAALSTLPPGVQLEPNVLRALGAARIVMDANYGERATLASLLNRPTVDGGAMLAAQARASFAIWIREFSGEREIRTPETG